MPMTVFLSHAPHDAAVVQDLRETLEPYGVSGWVDSQRLSAGDPFPERIREAISAAQHLIVLRKRRERMEVCMRF